MHEEVRRRQGEGGPVQPLRNRGEMLQAGQKNRLQLRMRRPGMLFSSVITFMSVSDIGAVVDVALMRSTEPRKSLGTWLREISSCSCLTFLPGPAWVLLSKICKDFFSALFRYTRYMWKFLTLLALLNNNNPGRRWQAHLHQGQVG